MAWYHHNMVEIYCPQCVAFTPLVFDEPYHWQGTEAAARNLICPQYLAVLSILRGDGAHALQKIAELAHYALPTDRNLGNIGPISVAAKRSRKTRRLKIVP
jgi:hypothetical protein